MLGCRTGSGRAAPVGRGGNNHARALFATAALLLAAMVAEPAQAQGFPPPESEGPASVEPGTGLNLSQHGVPAEATAENGVLARERALAAGRRTAWERMLAEAGAPPIQLSDSQIENLVSSIVIEQERISPTRYSGRITVNFNGAKVRPMLAGRVPGLPPVAAAPGHDGAAPTGPASNWLDAIANYRSMGEWLELRRRLQSSGAVASVEILGITVEAARLRIGLRAPPQLAAGDLAGLGIALAPATDLGPGQAWRVGLAGGG
ncbi:MAG: hypothetical protein IRY87_11125 [Acetobacteraceae bacterium]|nr:hypothetical protein [Acetobacteraceae bacterium]